MSEPQQSINEISLFPLDVNQVADLINDLDKGVYGVDLNGRCTFCNKQAIALLNYDSPRQLMGQNMFQLIHYADRYGNVRDFHESKLFKSLTEGVIQHTSLDWLWRKDGLSLPVEIWFYPIFKNNRLDGSIVTFIDISDRVESKKLLENSLERYRMLLESTQVIPWEFDLESQRFTFISPQAKGLFGHALTEWYRKNFWEENIHPNDREKTISGCMNAVKQGKAFELDYRFIKADKSFVYVRDYVNVISREGVPVALRGVFTDISTSKLQEEQLRLAAVTFDVSSGIFITDKSGCIVKINQAFSNITGYSETETLGQTPRLLKSNKQDAVFYQKMWKDLNTHGRWQGEIWNKKRSGEIFPEWLSISSVQNESGGISHFVAIFTDISEKKAAEEKIKFQAHFDELTHLSNRNQLNQRLEQAITQVRKFHHFGALLLLDLDEFKIINDSLGHEFGDKLLKRVAKRLKNISSNGDLVARLGGDEFAILLPDLGGDENCSKQAAENFAKEVCLTLIRLFKIDNQSIHLSGCVGITMFSKLKVNCGDVLKQADTAMYKAKLSGKNNSCLFTYDMQREADQRLTLKNDLKLALDKGSLYLHFQPQFNNQQVLTGMEALVRWDHPSKGLIPPVDFIPVAEKSGLIIQLGRWVLQSACETYAYWQSHYKGNLPRFSVNVSAQQFQQSSFPEMVLNCLANCKLPPDKLELEITEEVLIGDIDKTIEVIKYLQNKGVHFSIDDFGTGYSSLSYLKKLPIDLLKIDRSFIMNIPKDKDDVAITNTILSMAKHLNLKVIAEGVENQEQFEFLKSNGCDFYQGYYFSRPLSKEDFQKQILKL